MIKIMEYIDGEGKSAFRSSFRELEVETATKVTTSLIRMENGNYTNSRSIGGEVYEYKVQDGSGYRLHFAQDGDDLVILQGIPGAGKNREDEENAKTLWKEYKRESRGKKKI